MADSSPGCLTASVVIPTFNRREAVRATVDSVLADEATSEVVVVVDGSHDGTAEMLREWASTDARVRPVVTENQGEGRARQTGAEVARHEVLVFLDDDVIAGPLLVQGHLRHHSAGAGLVILGYMPTELPGPRRRGMFATALYARDYTGRSTCWETDPSSILRSLWGGNFSVRRSDALTVGLVAPRALPYHEDQAFGLRCLDHDLTGVFDRSLCARHVPKIRPPATFVADARRQGEAALILHRSASATPFPFTDEEPFPGFVRTVIGWAATPPVGHVIQRLLRVGIWGLGGVHAFHLEEYLAMVLRLAVQRETIISLQGSSHPRR